MLTKGVEEVMGIMVGVMEVVVVDGEGDEEGDVEEYDWVDDTVVVVVVTELWTSTHLVLLSVALNPTLHEQTASRLELLKEGSLQNELAVPASQSSSLSHFL